MTDLDALLAGIVTHPHEDLRWLVMADWLEDHGQPERAELVRVHRELLRTCTDPDAHPERPQLHARMMELMRAGVPPCLPQKTLALPGGVVLRMSFIPPGSFLMGSPESDRARSSDENQHRVRLTRAFWMGQAPATQAQWNAVMGTSPSYFKGSELPVEQVSWEEAQVFCGRVRELAGLVVRLPTEAEWEYAARAGVTTRFYWGNDLNGSQANCNGKVPLGTKTRGPNRKSTTAVGSYSTVSPHPWALLDVTGNVSEWCSDWHGLYPQVEVTDPMGPDTYTDRVLRGGGWTDDARNCRLAARSELAPDDAFRAIGFRLAADGDAFG